jgi:hypothetical protein
MGTSDISRNAFDPGKHYSSVRMQQGRVMVDDDWNENERIRLNELLTTVNDIIGRHGTPDDGFAIDFSNPIPKEGPCDFRFKHGTYYVNGLKITREADETYLKQNDWLLQQNSEDYFPEIPKDGKETYNFVFIEAWQQSVTSVEDEELIEKALGGVDTSTRIRTCHRIRIKQVEKNAGCNIIDEIKNEWKQKHSGQLTVDFTEETNDNGLCSAGAGGRYLGAENQAIRVQITGHKKLTWGFDNASPLYRITIDDGTDGNKIITMLSAPKDQHHWPGNGQIIEILPRSAVLPNKQKIASPDGTFGIIKSSYDPDNNQFTAKIDYDKTKNKEWDIPEGDDPEFYYMHIWDRGSDLDSEPEIEFDPDTFVELKHTGLKIKISGENHIRGDFWIIAVRPETSEKVVPWKLEEGMQPHGIARYFAPLAIVRWKNDGNKITGSTILDCRNSFPPLSAIMAGNVGFDNGNCKLSDTKTVQDALDKLCHVRDLRYHNKNLHGWGIVGGLQVFCGTEENETHKSVVVREGYAIDCNGNDLIIDAEKVIELIKLIRDNELVDESGEGEVSLSMRLDKQNNIIFETEKYDSSSQENKWKGGALIQNMYNNCIKPVIDLLMEGVSHDDKNKELVSVSQKRLTILINLLVQFVNKKYGGSVYISPEEDEILQDFYKRLRLLLESKTYCAMYHNARRIPEYPEKLKELNVPSIFGKGFKHTRLRIDPKERLACTVGGMDSPAGSNTIHVFDLKGGVMISETEFPGGKGIKVQDVAFSDDSKELYVIATVNDVDSMFAVADIIELRNPFETKLPGISINWRPVSTHCGVYFTSLATLNNRTGNIFVVGREKGLYTISALSNPVKAELKVPFDACGHLIIDQELERAYATSRNEIAVKPGEKENVTESAVIEKNLIQYDCIKSIDLKTMSVQTFLMRSHLDQKISLTGDDDIAIGKKDNKWYLFVVSNGHASLGNTNKQLLVYENPDKNTINIFPSKNIDLEANTDIKMAFSQKENNLMITYEDCFKVRYLKIGKDQLENDFHPVQVFPQSIVGINTDGNTKAYVYNWFSNTINCIPAKPSVYPVEILNEYRIGVIEAFVDLLGGFFQYLKDCFCSQFLVDCPDCRDNNKIYLASVKIKNNQVYQICNFSRRKYIKTFPTLEYWLSFLPVAPVIRKLFETVGCSVLPAMFGKFIAGEKPVIASQELLKGSSLRYGYANFKNLDLKGQYKVKTAALSDITKLSKDWANVVTAKKVVRPGKFVFQNSIVNAGVTDARIAIEKSNAAVDKVVPYDPRKVTKNLVTFTGLPPKIKEGQKVVLYEEGGIVRYYSLVDEKTDQINQLNTLVNSHENRIVDTNIFKKEVDQLRENVEVSEEEFRKTKITLASYEDNFERVNETGKKINDLNLELTASEARFNEKITVITQIQNELNTLNKKFDQDKIELKQGRVDDFNATNKKIDDLSTRLATFVQDVQKDNSEFVVTMKQDLSNLRTQIETERSVIKNEKAAEIQDLQNSINSLKTSLHEANIENQRLISTRDAEINTLKSSLDQFQVKMREIDTFQTKVTDYMKRKPL